MKIITKQQQETLFAPLDDVQFPWNDAINLTNDGDGSRGIVICLSAVFDAIQGLRTDIRVMTANQQDIVV